jgi:hypothetical protein
MPFLPFFYGWRESVVCSSLKYSFGLDVATKPGAIRPTSYGDTAAAQRRRNLDPLPASDHASLSSALPGFHHTYRNGVHFDKCTSLDRDRLRPGGFRPLPPPIPQAFLPLEKKVLPPERIDALLRELAEQYNWTIDHMDRDFFVAHTHPAWWSATWGEQIFVAHDRGGIWINSINDLGKRSSIVSFGYTRRNIRRVTEAIAAQEKDIHSPI